MNALGFLPFVLIGVLVIVAGIAHEIRSRPALAAKVARRIGLFVYHFALGFFLVSGLMLWLFFGYAALFGSVTINGGGP